MMSHLVSARVPQSPRVTECVGFITVLRGSGVSLRRAAWPTLLYASLHEGPEAEFLLLVLFSCLCSGGNSLC